MQRPKGIPPTFFFHSLNLDLHYALEGSQTTKGVPWGPLTSLSLDVLSDDDPLIGVGSDFVISLASLLILVVILESILDPSM